MQYLKKACLIFLLQQALCLSVSGRFRNTEGIDSLNLADRGKKIENSISFDVSGSTYELIKSKNGEKITVGNPDVLINGVKIASEDIGTRGGSTLLFRRKSYSFSLTSEAVFHHDILTESMRKFYALSLSMDKNYCNNHIAFGMMKKINLFDLFYSFGKVNINGQDEGICLIVQRPEDWALHKKNSPLMIRRGYNEKIDKLVTDKSTGKGKVENFNQYYNQIYRSLGRFEGEELYRTLSQWIDLENYMQWLAINYLVRNGDYTDEVFLYIDPETEKFRVIPWDYDDLFLPAPHEGKKVSQKILGDKLIFSSEDKLDQKIASDPYLYGIYLKQFRLVLTKLTPGIIREIFEETYAELYPYYSDPRIIAMSEFDSHRATNLEKLEYDLKTLYNMLVFTYRFYLDSLQDIE